MYKNYVYFNKEKSIEKYEQKMFGNSIFSNMIKVNKGLYEGAESQRGKDSDSHKLK